MDKRILKDRFGLTERQLGRILVARSRKEIKSLALYRKVPDEYSFAAIGDTHLCSIQEKLRELHTFYDLCRKRKISDVFHAGDVVAGQGIYSGQEYEVNTFGADNQVAYVVDKYPKVKGITTHFITGNHDYSFYKMAGVDVGLKIGEQREDMNFLGAFRGEVFYNGVKLIQLVHPDGGMPYALSYRAQKYVEQVASGSKPRVLLVGHLHTQYNFLYRNINVFGVGCWEGQTTFLARKGINPVIGGWFITVKFGKDKKKSIVSFVSEFVPFYL